LEKIPQQYSTNCLRIVLYGPESTGKTTLSQQLAEHYKTQWVPEYMRTYLEENLGTTKKTMTKQDLIPVAIGQIQSENELLSQAKDFIFCDTNLLELKVYSEYYYEGYCPDAIREAAQDFQYDYYFLTDIDVPWEPDDLRDRPYDRSTLFCKFENQLKEQNIPYSTLSGSKVERLETAISILERLKKTKDVRRKRS